MSAVVKHCRDGSVNMSERVITYNDKSYARRREIFLSACIYDVILGYIDGAGEDVT